MVIPDPASVVLGARYGMIARQPVGQCVAGRLFPRVQSQWPEHSLNSITSHTLLASCNQRWARRCRKRNVGR